MKDNLIKNILHRISSYEKILNKERIKQLKELIECIWNTHINNRKIIICGNGGSAADSMHFTAELIGHFKVERPPIYAVCLNTDQAVMTAIANDFNYNLVFSRQLQAVGSPGDLLIVLSASGNSKNIINVLHTAKQFGIKTAAILGNNGGEAADCAECTVCISCTDTAIIQELQQIIIHLVCEEIDQRIQAYVLSDTTIKK